MLKTYFKFRNKFDFSPHPFEIGYPIIQTWYYNQNFLFNKIRDLSESDYGKFYTFHLNHFLRPHPGQEKSFFEKCNQLTTDRIRYYKMQDPFSSRQKTYQVNLAKLEAFQSFLGSIDRLKAEIKALNEQIKAMKEYEPSEKIGIVQNHLGTFIDLIQQMQQLVLPEENIRLLNGQGKSGWYKMLARYFQHGGKPIPLETARNYFTGKTREENIKGTKIKNSHKLFKINQINGNPFDQLLDLVTIFFACPIMFAFDDSGPRYPAWLSSRCFILKQKQSCM